MRWIKRYACIFEKEYDSKIQRSRGRGRERARKKAKRCCIMGSACGIMWRSQIGSIVASRERSSDCARAHPPFYLVRTCASPNALSSRNSFSYMTIEEQPSNVDNDLPPRYSQINLLANNHHARVDSIAASRHQQQQPEVY